MKDIVCWYGNHVLPEDWLPFRARGGQKWPLKGATWNLVLAYFSGAHQLSSSALLRTFLGCLETPFEEHSVLQGINLKPGAGQKWSLKGATWNFVLAYFCGAPQLSSSAPNCPQWSQTGPQTNVRLLCDWYCFTDTLRAPNKGVN